MAAIPFVMKQSRGTYASVDLAAAYFADYFRQGVFSYTVISQHFCTQTKCSTGGLSVEIIARDGNYQTFQSKFGQNL
jgi:hypothetical protein